MADLIHSPGADKGSTSLGGKLHPAAAVLFFGLLAGGLIYVAQALQADIARSGEHLALGVFVLLGLALLIALGFEFVNGFHDTANAVATVIYTNSMPPVVAVVWSGIFNFAGVLLSTAAVAYGIIKLLPAELILNVGSGAGYAMIFALLIAAIVWNLGTWALGIPNSSSHAMVGSIMGVGLANQLMAKAGRFASGVDWDKALEVLKALLISPLIGFAAAAVLLMILKRVVRNPKLYQAPEGQTPPPLLIRLLLIGTCTSVSFAHGSNDGQKGMGLIMLILIGAAPTAYALNRTMPAADAPAFVRAAEAAGGVLATHGPSSARPDPIRAQAVVGQALRTGSVTDPAALGALAVLSHDIAGEVTTYGSISHVPAAATKNLRTEMFLSSEALRMLGKDKAKAVFSADEAKVLAAYSKGLEQGTRFIPAWVKVAVALALGLGTMVGWKRIVVTVGERIGKTHLTYAQGASAELVAAATIGLAQSYGLPVSTTHILSSGVAGTMAANGSGLQWSTIRSIAVAWVLTLPAAMALSGTLYFLLLRLVGG